MSRTVRRTGIELIRYLRERLAVREAELAGLRVRLMTSNASSHEACSGSLKALIRSRRNRVRELRARLRRAEWRGR